MTTDFRRKIDGMLRDAERTVTTGGSSSTFGPRATVNTSCSSSSLVPYGAASSFQQRASSAAPDWGGGGGGGSAAADAEQQSHHQSHVDPLQQLMANNTAASRAAETSVHVQTLQEEVAELRRELRAERESKESLANSIVRRVKDELRSETVLANREMESHVGEMSAHLRTRLTDVETMAQACARRCDEVTRAVKVCNNDIFDMNERNTAQFSEIKSQTDAAFAMASSTKVDCARAIEKERMNLERKVEVELVRFTELEREQRKAVDSVKDRMAAELRDVNQSVEKMVADAWDTRARSFISTVNEALDAVKSQSRTVAATMAESTSKVDSLGKQVKQLQSLDTQVFDQRLSQVETVVPNLSTRVDRTEKRSEALLDSNSRLTASVDVLREAADRAAAHAVRCVERLQTFEGTLSDRDSRLTSVESALVHVQGAERVKGELESVKRSISRVESIADAMKSNNQRDERVVENLERSVDTMTARWEGLDSKLAKTATRCETLDSRMAAVSERAAAVEATSDKLSTALQQNANELQVSVGVLTRRCDGTESKVSSQLEQQESVVCDVRNRAMSVEATCNAMRISVESATQTAQSARGEADKLLRKVNTLEAAQQQQQNSINAKTAQMDQQQMVEERLGSLTNTVAGLRSKVDALQKQQTTLAQRQDRTNSPNNNNNNNSPSHPRGGGAGADATVLANVQSSTEMLQSSAQSMKNQLTVIERRLGTLETMQMQRNNNNNTSFSASSPADSSSPQQKQQLSERVNDVEQTCRVLKSKSNSAQEKFERFESMFRDVDERIDSLEDNFSRMAEYRAKSGSGERAAPAAAAQQASSSSAFNKNSNIVQPQQQQQQQEVSITQPRPNRTIMAPVPTPNPTPRSAVSGGLSPMSNNVEQSPSHNDNSVSTEEDDVSPPPAAGAKPKTQQQQSPVNRIQDAVAEAWRGGPNPDSPVKRTVDSAGAIISVDHTRRGSELSSGDSRSSPTATNQQHQRHQHGHPTTHQQEASAAQLQLGGRRVATPLPSDAFNQDGVDDDEDDDLDDLEDDDIEEEVLPDDSSPNRGVISKTTFGRSAKSTTPAHKASSENWDEED